MVIRLVYLRPPDWSCETGLVRYEGSARRADEIRGIRSHHGDCERGTLSDRPLQQVWLRMVARGAQVAPPGRSRLSGYSQVRQTGCRQTGPVSIIKFACKFRGTCAVRPRRDRVFFGHGRAALAVRGAGTQEPPEITLQDRVAGTRINRRISTQGSGNPRTAYFTSSHGKREPDKTAQVTQNKGSGKPKHRYQISFSACRLLGPELE